MRRYIILTVTILCSFISMYGQSSLQGEKIFTGKEFDVATPVINFGVQNLSIRSRKLELKFDMGEIYGLHHQDQLVSATPWGSQAIIEVIAKRDGETLETYNLIIDLNKEAPEKTVLLSYNDHANTIDKFQVKVVSVSNNLGQSYERLTIDFKDDIGYDVVDQNGEGIAIDYRYTSKVLSEADATGNQEVIGASFNWFLPEEGQHFDHYLFSLLKLEPDLEGNVSQDWSRAVTIELDADKLNRGWGGDHHLYYKMNLTEGTGYYAWRVQPVGTFHESRDYRSFGAFSNTSTSDYPDFPTLFTITKNEYGVVTNYSEEAITEQQLSISNPGNVESHLFYYTQYEEDINWIYSRVWSEGNKQAESISYADGLSHVKQNQSKLFSENQVIGSQSVYDYLGRTSLSPLPAPMDKTNFGYKEDFFLSPSGKEYSATDFDEDQNIYHTSDPLNSPNMPQVEKGSPAKYYSEENDLGDYANRVPDAEGVPYARSLFYKDGRPYKSAGAGDVMSLKNDVSGKNPTFYYGSPAEEELVRVFGEEAPQKNNAQKTIAIDPNGVANVTYTNKTGQTIASCLSYATGDLPSLDNIGNEETFDISYQMPTGNVIGNENTSTMSLALEIQQQIDFDYEFDVSSYDLPCGLDAGIPCDYHIEITISHAVNKTDENSNVKFLIDYNQDNNSGCPTDQLKLSCMDNVTLIGPDGSENGSPNFLTYDQGQITLPGGMYTISKVVSVNNTGTGDGLSYLEEKVKELEDGAAEWTEGVNCGCDIDLSDILDTDCEDLLDEVCNQSRAGQIDVIAQKSFDAQELQFDDAYLQKLRQSPAFEPTRFTKQEIADAIEQDYDLLTVDASDEINDDTERCYQVMGSYIGAYAKLEYNISTALSDESVGLTVQEENDPALLEEHSGKQIYNSEYDFIAYCGELLDEKKEVYDELIKVDYNPSYNYPGNILRTDNKPSYEVVIADPTIDFENLSPPVTVQDKNDWLLAVSYNTCVSLLFDFDQNGKGVLKHDGVSYSAAVKDVKTCVENSSQDLTPFTSPNGIAIAENEQLTIDAINKQISDCQSVCESKRNGGFQFAFDDYMKEYNETNNDALSPEQVDWQTFEELSPNPFGSNVQESCLINTLVSSCYTKCEQPLQLAFLETGVVPDLEAVLLEQKQVLEAMSYVVDVMPVGNYTTGAPVIQVEQEILDFIFESLDKGINKRILNYDEVSGGYQVKARIDNEDFIIQDGDETKKISVAVKTHFIDDLSEDIYNYKFYYLSIEVDGVHFISGEKSIALGNNSPLNANFGFDDPFTDIKNELIDFYFDRDHVIHFIVPDPGNWESNNNGLYHLDEDDVQDQTFIFSNNFAFGEIDKAIKIDLKDLSNEVMQGNGKADFFLRATDEDGTNTEILFLNNEPIEFNSDHADKSLLAQEIASSINNGQYTSIRAGVDDEDLYIYFLRNSQFANYDYDQALYFDCELDNNQSVFLDGTDELAFTEYGKLDLGREVQGIDFFDQVTDWGVPTQVDQECPIGYQNYNQEYNPELYELNGGAYSNEQKIELPNTGSSMSLNNVNIHNYLNDNFVLEFGNNTNQITYELNGFYNANTETDFNIKLVFTQTYAEICLYNINDGTEECLEKGFSSYGIDMSDNEISINVNLIEVDENNFDFVLKIDDIIIQKMHLGTLDVQPTENGSWTFVSVNGGDKISPFIESCAACISYKNASEVLNQWPVHEQEITLTCEEEQQRYYENNINQQLNACLIERIEALRENYGNCIHNFTDNLDISYPVSYHHYTLFYYGRNGQLIKTVPPQGVNKLTNTQIQAIITNRKELTTGVGDDYIPLPILPAHNLTTTYKHNSVGNVISTTTPDGGTNKLWYNAHGQVVLSQDAQQTLDNNYSYIKYDKLGRPIDAGELENPQLTFDTEAPIDGATETSDLGYEIPVEAWTNLDFPEDNLYTRIDWNKTYYTTPADIEYLEGGQRHLRNRVSYVVRDEDGDRFTKDDQHMTYFSYDGHGNVEWMVQEIPGLGRKGVSYEYDLVSGNTNKVIYQGNTSEQFIHKYTYDEDNRIVDVYTSRDDVTYTREIHYDFYLGGTIARTELGDDDIQGCDYIYTINGRLKAMNQPELLVDKDPGRDGLANAFLPDEFGMELGYYDGDYDKEATYLGKDGEHDPYAQVGLFDSDDQSKNLYNGNVSYWMANTRADQEEVLLGVSHEQVGMHLNLYRYDKLNRIKRSEYKSLSGSNQWDDYGGFNSPAYLETFKYDYNGNIDKILRNGGKPTTNATLPFMDNLLFYYKEGTNQLLAVADIRGTSGDDTDIGSQISYYTEDVTDGQQVLPDEQLANLNYVYDAEGNMVQDKQENLTISWNNLNRIQSVVDADDNSVIEFSYDAGGNRVSKSVIGALSKKTYYVRDANGNVLAIYEHSNNDLVLKEQPIYGQGRIGQFVPDLVLSSGEISDDDIEGVTGHVDLLHTSAGMYLFNQEENSSRIDRVKTNDLSSGAFSDFVYENGVATLAVYSERGGIHFANRLGEEVGVIERNINELISQLTLITGPAENEYYVLTKSTGNTLIHVLYDPQSSQVTVLEEIYLSNVAPGPQVVSFGDGTSRLYFKGKDDYVSLYAVTIDVLGVSEPELVFDDKSLVYSSNDFYPIDVHLSPDQKRIAWSEDNGSKIVLANLSLSTNEISDFTILPLEGKAFDFEFSNNGNYLYYCSRTGTPLGSSLYNSFELKRYDINLANHVVLKTGADTPYAFKRDAKGDLYYYQYNDMAMKQIINEDGNVASLELDGSPVLQLPLGTYKVTSQVNKTIYVNEVNNESRASYSHRVVGRRYYEQKDHLGNVRAVLSDARKAELVTDPTKKIYYNDLEYGQDATFHTDGSYSIKLEDGGEYESSETFKIPVKQGEDYTVSVDVYWLDAARDAGISISYENENGPIDGTWEPLGNVKLINIAPGTPYHLVLNRTVRTDLVGDLILKVTLSSYTTVPVWFDAFKVELDRSTEIIDEIYVEDMEDLSHQSHSSTEHKLNGLYSSKVVNVSGQQYGAHLEAPVTSGESFEISSHVYWEENGAHALLVYAYMDENGEVISGSWNGISIDDAETTILGEWNTLTRSIVSVPTFTGYTVSSVLIYPWSTNTGSLSVWFDDITVKKERKEVPLYTYATDVKSWSDYYAFGSVMPGRHVSESDYRYGFNGAEKDDEVKGEGNHYNLGLRVYDPRLGKMFSHDPREREFPWQSTYAYYANNPTNVVDFMGGGPCPRCPRSGSLNARVAMHLKFTIGTKNTSYFNFGASGSLMANGTIGLLSGQLNLNASASFSNGGVSSPFATTTSFRGGVGDIAFSSGFIAGGGDGAPIALNYLNGDASTSLINPIKYSGAYTLNFHRNTVNRAQRTATYGFRIGQFSVNAEEDAPFWLGADKEDRWWTGSGNANWDFHNGNRFTYGFDTYTGHSLNKGTLEQLGDTQIGGVVNHPLNKHNGKPWYWANQSQMDKKMGLPLGFNQSLNNSRQYLQYTSSTGYSFMISSTSPSDFGIQNLIHDYLNNHHFIPSTNYNTYQASGSSNLGN